MNTDELRVAYDTFLAEAENGGFGPPPAGEWDAEHLLAHLVVGHSAILSNALAIVAGERTAYDNRASLDEWNLRRVIARAGGMPGLIDLIRRQADLFIAIAGQIDDEDLDVRLPIFILSNDELVVDEPRPLRFLVEGVGQIHLPLHTQQLLSLRP
ncbi:maleylpyruvate isomerase mycothiol-dependent enzyme family protein [Flindersiella endophytica]